jgi:surfactin synthase thioesterase subunit
MARVLPLVRADFTLLEGHRIAPTTRLSCPITLFVGDRDPGVPPLDAAHWRELTGAGFRMIEFSAGHFYLDSHRDPILAELQRTLTGT